jgi:hypothetical protein
MYLQIAFLNSICVLQMYAKNDLKIGFQEKRRDRKLSKITKNWPNNEYSDHNRVAKWFNFKPKIPIWVNFGGP